MNLCTPILSGMYTRAENADENKNKNRKQGQNKNKNKNKPESSKQDAILVLICQQDNPKQEQITSLSAHQNRLIIWSPDEVEILSVAQITRVSL